MKGNLILWNSFLDNSKTYDKIGVNMDYGSWLTEDLRDLKDALLRDRDRSESYSDRALLNQQILEIMAEIQTRNDIDE